MKLICEWWLSSRKFCCPERKPPKRNSPPKKKINSQNRVLFGEGESFGSFTPPSFLSLSLSFLFIYLFFYNFWYDLYFFKPTRVVYCLCFFIGPYLSCVSLERCPTIDIYIHQLWDRPVWSVTRMCGRKFSILCGLIICFELLAQLWWGRY